MKTRQIEAFKVVMECGSMTAAAEKLFVTQPAVTKLIAQLEYDIKFPLFERAKSRLIPTDDAKIFYQHVLRTFQALEDLSQVAKDIKGLNRGHLVVSTLPLLSTQWIPNQCAIFADGKDSVNIALNSKSSHRVQEWIVSGQSDIGISMIANDRRVNAELLAEIEAVCILPSGHPLAEKDSIVPKDLNGETFIMTGGVDGTRGKIEGLFKALNVSPKIKYETVLSSSTCALVASGGGAALVNIFSAKEFAHFGYDIRPFRPKIDFQIYLLTARNRRISRVAEAFVEQLRINAKSELNLTLDTACAKDIHFPLSQPVP